MKGQIFITFTVIFIVLAAILYSNWFSETHKPEKSINKFLIENLRNEITNLVEISILNSNLEENINLFLNFSLRDIEKNKIKISAIYCFINETDIIIGNFLDKPENFTLILKDSFGKREYNYGIIENFSSISKSITPNGDYEINIFYGNESLIFNGKQNENVFSIKLIEKFIYENGYMQLNIKRYKM